MADAVSEAAESAAAGSATALPGLCGRRPVVAPERLVAELVPPPRFAAARFETYLPDPGEPSQAAARELLAGWAAGASDSVGARAGRGGLFRRGRGGGRGEGVSVGGGVGGSGVSGAGGTARGTGLKTAGVYLDGGYGVGKTHLLASLWHATTGPKSYGTFVEYTNLVGALGFAGAVARLSTRRLVCIDEFELDDPGDTVLVSTLLARLAEAGVRLAASSNTLPDRLGEGRFAAADFMREIQGLAARFTAVRIDGPDYRRRDTAAAPRPFAEDELSRLVELLAAQSTDADSADGADAGGGARAGVWTEDGFDDLLAHLGTLHPSRYGALLDGVAGVVLRGLRPVDDQNAALRLVVLVDRLYDRSVPVLASGVPVDQLFTTPLLTGGFRKKYLRAVSRLVALAGQGAAAVPALR